MSFAPAVGVVFLPDLLSRHVWMKDELPGILQDVGLSLSDVEVSSMAPPSHLIAICTMTYVPALARCRAWLADAEVLRVVVSFHDEPGAFDDEEIRELVDLELEDSLQGLHPTEVIKVRDIRESTLLVHALATGERSAHPSPVPILSLGVEHPSGPWCPFEGHDFRDSDTFLPALACVRDSAPSLYSPKRRAFMSLHDGTYGETVLDEQESYVAAWPDGERLFSTPTQSSPQFVHDLNSKEARQSPGVYGSPIGVWPGGRIGWRGGRCTYSWLYASKGEICSLVGCEHDWPCGHEKKQYGFLDNEPCWVHLSRLGDAYLSVYQKDAIISSAVPLRWRRCERGWAATSTPCLDPGRALFFIGEGRWCANDPTDPDACDVRDARPAIVLGPSADARYALALDRPVYRLTNEKSVLVHPPEGVYGVFDAQHGLRRMGIGRLLGGWDRWLTVLHGGELWRDDTESGERRPLGPPGAEVDWAFSLPGTPNLILVEKKVSALRVRLV